MGLGNALKYCRDHDVQILPLEIELEKLHEDFEKLTNRKLDSAKITTEKHRHVSTFKKMLGVPYE